MINKDCKAIIYEENNMTILQIYGGKNKCHVSINDSEKMFESRSKQYYFKNSKNNCKKIIVKINMLICN